MRSGRKSGYEIGTTIPSPRPQAWLPAPSPPLDSSPTFHFTTSLHKFSRESYIGLRTPTLGGKGVSQDPFPTLMFSLHKCRNWTHKTTFQEYHNDGYYYERLEGNQIMCEPHTDRRETYVTNRDKKKETETQRNWVIHPELEQTIKSRATYLYNTPQEGK